MASNRDLVRQKYSGGNEEGRDKRSRYHGLEFHYTKKLLADFIDGSSNIIEVGCGTGYYGMHFAPVCASYRGIDLTPCHISIFNEKIAESGLSNITAEVGDAVNLVNVPDSAADTVLCLGPMYHLNAEERRQSFLECHRILSDGGTAAFSYISTLGVYAGVCAQEKLIEFYPNKNANELVLGCGTDDINKDVFFFATPEEMEQTADECGFEVIKNCGVDFMMHMTTLDMMTEEQFECYMELADRMVESRYCTGMANHALLICRKKGNKQ